MLFAVFQSLFIFQGPYFQCLASFTRRMSNFIHHCHLKAWDSLLVLLAVQKRLRELYATLELSVLELRMTFEPLATVVSKWRP